jgi:hypothetical protein
LKKFSSRHLICFEILLIIIFASIILFLDGSDFLGNLPSTRFGSSGSKIYFNVALIFIWVTFNHSLIFLLKKKWILNEKTSLFLMLSLLALSFVLAAMQISGLRKYIDKFYYFFGIGHLHPEFIDLRGVLAGINKAKKIGDPFSVECNSVDEPCIGWGWSYGSTILKLRNLYIFKENYTHIFAFAIFLIFCTVIIKLSKDLISRNIYMLLMGSGVSLIIIERMNIDILVLFLIFWISWAKKDYTKIISFLGIILFSLTKYYTFILIPFIILFEKSNKIRITYSILTFISIPIAFNDIKSAGSGSLNFGYAATFGLKNLIGSILNTEFPSYGNNLLPFLIIVLCLGIFLICLIHIYNQELNNLNIVVDEFIVRLFVLSSISIVFAWVLASNYPYRMVSVLGTIPFFVKIFKDNQNLLVLNIGLIFISFNSLPISLTISRNLFFGVFMVSLIAVNFVILSKFIHHRESFISQFQPRKRRL